MLGNKVAQNPTRGHWWDVRMMGHRLNLPNVGNGAVSGGGGQRLAFGCRGIPAIPWCELCEFSNPIVPWSPNRGCQVLI